MNGNRNRILLSIIIPIYNVENYLGKCLNSIVQDPALGDGKVEVILIDDGSTDSSGFIADRYAEEYSYMKVIHSKNAGVAAARNLGMDNASGEWLYFVDSDDWLADHGISTICCRIRRHGNMDMILFDAYKNYDDRVTAWEHFDSDRIINKQDEIRALQREVLYFHKTPLAAPWDKVYRRAFLEGNQIRFQEKLKVLDDMIFNLEVFGALKEAAYCMDKIYHYSYTPDSVTNSYKPDRVEQDVKVWNYLEQYMNASFAKEEWSKEDKEMLRQAYFSRVIKSFAICCRLCFFCKENPNSINRKVAYLKEVLQLSPYRDAFSCIDMRNVDWKLKAVIIMARLHAGLGIYMLHLLESFGNRYLQAG